jgi:hypothetical protein
MKPSKEVVRRRDYTVQEIPFSEAAALIRAHHYARGCANTATAAHGLVRKADGVLVGAALWMPPTRVCAESVDREEWRRVLALSRLAIAPGEPQNAASLLIGGSVRLLRRSGRWAALVTFADESQGHTGGIYRATNWTHVGRTAPEPRWVDADGRQVARKATHSRTAAEMRALGYRVDGRYRKEKFVLHLAA